VFELNQPCRIAASLLCGCFLLAARAEAATCTIASVTSLAFGAYDVYAAAPVDSVGTIDYEAGTLNRPAPWVTNWGLEWLYRLVREPRQRWHRYLVHQPPVLYHLARQRLGLYRNPFEER